ncbi:probable carboxylesterase 1 [Chenopodium quinoa]|uniref:Alpha/beta hydrolase fold-3 domain-containing protein n=1 Tax=Chenopodium quinoa TaxID=63459 RepID=A0A803MTW5_CHEQI|nr:probable carboxylesterase 1 [Chenopodium quinoa]
MDSSNNNYCDKVVFKSVLFNVFKDGRFVLRFPDATGQKVPPLDDLATGVKIKDVQISPEVSTRIFLPRVECTTTTINTCNKLPLLLYIHGGGFCMESASSKVYTRYVSNLSFEANIIVVSVEYNLFPTRALPACYEDSWAALQWVAAHEKGCGPDPWINHHADLQRVFVGGDSAGGNISHTVLARVGPTRKLGESVRVEGMILGHPYFGIGGRDEEMWLYMCPTNEGPNDRRLKPTLEDLGRLGCGRVLVLVAENDPMNVAGKRYVENLIKSGWKGMVEIVVNKNKNHCFHLYKLDDPEAIANMRRITSFIHHRNNDVKDIKQLNSHLHSCL